MLRARRKCRGDEHGDSFAPWLEGGGVVIGDESSYMQKPDCKELKGEHTERTNSKC